MSYAIGTSEIRHADGLRRLVLLLPLYLFIFVCWLIRPLSSNNIALAYLVPLSFVIGLILFQAKSDEFLVTLRRVKIELTLTMVMSILSVLSIINNDQPFQIFRVLFPCMLPILLFFQLSSLRMVSPQAVAVLPKHFLVVGFAFTCIPLFLSSISGGVDAYVFFKGGHRYAGFFDHPNQQSVMIAALVPLGIAEIAVANRKLGRWLWIAVVVSLLYALLRTGSKTALFVTFGTAWLFYILAHAHFYSLSRNLLRAFGIIAFMTFLSVYGVHIASLVDPVTAQNIQDVFSGGVENYRTIESRMELWQVAWNEGVNHWLIGTGAGEAIGGSAHHAHNLVLEYFRGIGAFGAIAVALLCVRVLWRAVAKVFPVLTGRALLGHDIRIMACYTSSAVYVLCNQLSNSFGPGTIAALWMIYIPAVLSERSTSPEST